MNDFKEAIAKPEPGMSAHSPGPWEINWNYAGGGSLEKFGYLHYANIHSHKYMQSAPEGLSITGYIRKEDACLIAAAPDLLEAAKAIAAASHGVALGDLERLVAAIAKAEGQS